MKENVTEKTMLDFRPLKSGEGGIADTGTRMSKGAAVGMESNVGRQARVYFEKQ